MMGPRCLLLVALSATVAMCMNDGQMMFYDPSGALFYESEAAEMPCSAMAAGEWTSRLGAPASMGGAQNLPVADLLEPLDYVTLLVIPVERDEVIVSSLAIILHPLGVFVVRRKFLGVV